MRGVGFFGSQPLHGGNLLVKQRRFFIDPALGQIERRLVVVLGGARVKAGEVGEGGDRFSVLLVATDGPVRKPQGESGIRVIAGAFNRRRLKLRLGLKSRSPRVGSLQMIRASVDPTQKRSQCGNHPSKSVIETCNGPHFLDRKTTLS